MACSIHSTIASIRPHPSIPRNRSVTSLSPILNFTPGTPPPAGTKVSPSNVQPDIATPAVLTWSLRVEQQIAPRTSLTVGYVGSHSYHQILSEDMNEPVPTFEADGSALYPVGTPNANPALANSTSWVSQGVGAYNSLIVDVRRSFGSGFQFRGNYTYSKNLDDGSAWNTSVSGNTPAFVDFPLRPKLDWGPAATDVRNAASLNGSYELPFGPHRHFLKNASAPVNFVAAGWTASAIVNVESGFPFSPQLGYNPTGNGDTRNPVRPNWNPNFSGTLYPRTPTQYFNPQAFLPPATGTYGNVSRDALTGPGRRSWISRRPRTLTSQKRCSCNSARNSSTSSTTRTSSLPTKWCIRRQHPASRPLQGWSRPRRRPRARFNSARSCSSRRVLHPRPKAASHRSGLGQHAGRSIQLSLFSTGTAGLLRLFSALP